MSVDALLRRWADKVLAQPSVSGNDGGNMKKFLDYLIAMAVGRDDLPKLDLLCKDVLDVQIKNAMIFRRRWRRVIFSICVFVGTFAFFPDEKNILIVVYFLFFFGSIIFVLVSMWAFKCPNCGVIPLGRSFSLWSSISYSSGINPFPIRCKSCGFYLNMHKLKSDLRKVEQGR